MRERAQDLGRRIARQDLAAPVIGPDTAVLSLQNGLGHEDILAEIVGREHVLAGKTYVGGETGQVVKDPATGTITGTASVSGTYGITGSVDTIVVVRRKRNEAFGTIHVTGRDVAEPVEVDGQQGGTADGRRHHADQEQARVVRGSGARRLRKQVSATGSSHAGRSIPPAGRRLT